VNLSSGTDERCRFWYRGCGGNDLIWHSFRRRMRRYRANICRLAPRTKTYATELNFRALLDEEASEVELALV
jgi:hypothetical protein